MNHIYLKVIPKAVKLIMDIIASGFDEVRLLKMAYYSLRLFFEKVLLSTLYYTYFDLFLKFFCP